MQTAVPERDALLRRRVQHAIAELRQLGVPDRHMRNLTIVELEEMAARCWRALMAAPKAA